MFGTLIALTLTNPVIAGIGVSLGTGAVYVGKIALNVMLYSTLFTVANKLNTKIIAKNEALKEEELKTK